MIIFRCNSCFRSNIPTKDLPCPYCGGDDLFGENLNPSQAEPQPIYFSHESTTATREANSQLVGSSSNVQDQNESTLEGFSFSYEDSVCGSKWTHVECRGREIVDTTNLRDSNIRLKKEQPSQNFSQYPIVNKRLLPVTESICVESLNEEDNDSLRVHNLQATVSASMAKQQYLMNLPHLQSCSENQNQPWIETVNKKHKTTESTQIENDEFKKSFTGWTHFEAKKSILRDYPASMITENNRRDTGYEGNTSYPDLLRKRDNAGTADTFSEHFEMVPQQEDHPSQQQTRNEGRGNACALLVKRLPVFRSKGFLVCEKCGNRFRNESQFNAHVQTNCDPKPFRCDKCPRKYYWKINLTQHRVVHSDEKQFKCDQCPKAYKFQCSLKEHKKKCR